MMASDDETQKMPRHVLQYPLHQQNEILDENLQEDFLGKRHKTWQQLKERKGRYKVLEKFGGKTEEGAIKSDPDEHDDELDDELWSGASPLERALVGCCDAFEDPSLGVPGGCLSRGKQVEFTGLLARHCHNTASQALALSIISRTLDRDDAAQYETDDDNGDDDDGDDDDGDDEDDEDEDGTDEDEGDDKMGSKKAKSEDKKCIEGENGNRNGKMIESESKDGSVTKEEEIVDQSSGGLEETNTVVKTEDEKDDDLDRITPFLAAGGLMILGGWLEDALMTVEKVDDVGAPAQKKQKRTNSPPPSKRTLVASPTGPVVIPLIEVLELIPFHKMLVKETKINKIIRNKKKQIDAAVQNFEGSARKLEEWRDPIAGGNIVVQVQRAFESLMEAWKEKAKESVDDADPKNPFRTLLVKIRRNYQDLVKFKSGKGQKPDWLEEKPSEANTLQSPDSPSRSPTQQREADERRKEKEKIRESMQKTQKEREQARERLEQLRNKIREQNMKRKAEEQQGVNKSRRKVKWKDGLETGTSRRRNLLEDVFEYQIYSEKEQEGSDVEMKVELNLDGMDHSPVFGENPGDEEDWSTGSPTDDL
mmetsp:Transcript_8702/g.12308  ORF Transcript_8702/g.12308 Transcript_8702/m.12308 type:complete len:593 (-) Transcript_8702:86-1864(-)